MAPGKAMVVRTKVLVLNLLLAKVPLGDSDLAIKTSNQKRT